MSIGCRIHRNKVSNEVIGVEAPNGKNSLLYDNALKYTNDKEEALKLYSIGNSDEFKKNNIDEFENENFVKDINGEPLLEDVINFLKLTEKNNISIDNKIHFDNLSNSFNGDNEQLKNILSNAFLDELGNFEIDENKIRKSNLYSEEEIENILSDNNTQNNIKNNIYNLDKFNSTKSNDYNLKITTEGFDSFGKKLFYKEEDLLDDILNKTTTVNNEEDFNKTLKEILPENIFNAIYDNKSLYDRLLGISLNSKNIEVKTFKNNNIENVLKIDTFNSLKNSLLIHVNKELLKNLEILSNLSYDTILNNYDDISKLLTSIEKQAIESNVDIIGLKDNYLNSEIEKSHSFIKTLNSFFKSIDSGIINDHVLKTYSDIYNEYFNIQHDNKIVNIDFLNSNKIYYIENLDDLNAYKNNLLHIKDNFYIKIDNYKYEDLKNKILEEYKNGNNIFEKIIPENIKSDYILNRYIESIIEDKINSLKDKVDEQNIQDYKSIILLKTLFNSEDSKYKKNKEIDSDFISDLTSTILNEKFKNSELYNKIYKFLSIENNSVKINSKEQIIKDRINNILDNTNINNKLKEYFKEDVYKSDRESAFYNKENIDYLNKDFEKYKDIILTNINKDFIKLDNEVYEKIDDSKDIVIYSKLVKNKEGIVLSEINKEFEGVMKENISKLKNYYSNSEKEKLMEEINNCN